ncbi:MAG: SCP2 sterol-binding domain-containing protein [Pseudomonadales bacterium]|nr:SCP2 sterol-binding domain-containing protein [Pseudomonadales bacterium]
MLTQAIENLLNRNLAQSPRARELCLELTGKRIRVTATGPDWQLEIGSLGTSLTLTSDWRPLPAGAAAMDSHPAPEVAATIAGTPLSLAALVSDEAEQVMRRGDVRISGDAEVAQRFQQILQLLQPDAEEELARLIGDSPAHQLLRLARGVLGFGRRAARTSVRNTAEFFAYESRDLVPKPEAEDFFVGVDRLREDLDRLDARVAALDAATARAEQINP